MDEPHQPTAEVSGAPLDKGSASDVLPYSKWWPVVAGVMTGVMMRLAFSGRPGGPYAAMMSSFVLLVPLLVGATTVYVAELRQRRSWLYYAWSAVVANVLFVVATMVVMLEGLICAVLIVPLFSAVGAIGGLLMGAVCRRTSRPHRMLFSVATLPLLLGGFEQHVPLPDRERTIERTRVVHAPASDVWFQIENPTAIAAAEVEQAWVYRIGVPVPKAGRTERTAEGMVRHITMGKGIHFDELATVWQPERQVRWANRFAADSFPADTMDEHVKIGGNYFAIGDTDYLLAPVAGGTELRMIVRYRLTTSFNWYAGPALDLLVADFEDAILGFYARRAEKGAAGARPSIRSAATAAPAGPSGP